MSAMNNHQSENTLQTHPAKFSDKPFLDKFFQISKRGSNIKTECLAGLTTFMTCLYVLAVNPAMMTQAGMDQNAVFWATALCCSFGSIAMGLVANLPLAQAPGMGLNAYFIFYVVGTLGLSWQNALGCVFISGAVFCLLSIFKVQQKISDAIPKCVKFSVGPGIGLFIALVGLTKADFIKSNPITMVELGDISSPKALLAFAGLLLTLILYLRKIKGSLFLGIIAITIAAMFVDDPATGQAFVRWPEGGIFKLENPLSALAPTLGQLSFNGMFNHSGVMFLGVLFAIFSFLFVDLLNGVATLLGTAAKVNFLDENGNLPVAGKALLVTAAANMPAAFLGAHTVVIYGAESASGIAEGGRTGLTPVVVGLLFLLTLFLSPLFLMVPLFATAPALIIIGVFMLEPLKYVDLSTFEDALPVFCGLVITPLTFSIAHGILFSVLAFGLTKVVLGKSREISPVLWGLSFSFVLFLAADLCLKIVAGS